MADKEQEIWKVYPEFPFIEASNLGRIKTKDRYVRNRAGKRLVKGQVLKQCLLPNGYMYVDFRVNGKKFHRYVHRIVATCFLPNPNNYPEVNHIDNDRKNNAVSNLEWCTRQYNSDYKKKFGTSSAQVLGHPVFAVNLETGKVLRFETQSEAARQLGVSVGYISCVIRGLYNKAKGFWFTYADENATEKTRIKFGDEVAEKVEKLMKQNQK